MVKKLYNRPEINVINTDLQLMAGSIAAKGLDMPCGAKKTYEYYPDLDVKEDWSYEKN